MDETIVSVDERLLELCRQYHVASLKIFGSVVRDEEREDSDIDIRGVNEEKFAQTSLLQDGVIRQLEIIGEATRHLSKSLRRQYPEVPWQDIAGMQDKLIHDYFGVDIDTV